MIRHTFKLVWNRKKRNFLLISEIFFSFLVLFAVATMAISSTIGYLKPRGFSFDNVWVLHVGGWRGTDDESADAEARVILQNIQREMEAYDEIRDVSWTMSNYPWSGTQWRTGFEWDGQNFSVDYFATDDDFADVMGLSIAEGRWFSKEDDATTRTPVVLTRKLKEMLLGDEPAVGKVHAAKDEEYVIVGVVDSYRYRGEFDEHRGGFFQRNVLSDTTSDMPYVALFSVREGTGVNFEEQITKRLAALAPGWTLRIETLPDGRTAYLKERMLGLIILGTVAGFLVFNVALGLYGVLWYSVSRRRGEVGLRRAVGADARQISGQILGEALVMATFAIIIGTFFAGQAPILGFFGAIGTVTYLIAMVAAAALIYLLVAICALYPSFLAARIAPAAALHSD